MLQTDGGTPLTLNNPDASQLVDELVVAYPGTAMDDNRSLSASLASPSW